MTIREEDISRCSARCFGKKLESPKTDRSEAYSSDEHDQPRMCISIDQNESPQSEIIPNLKGKNN